MVQTFQGFNERLVKFQLPHIFSGFDFKLTNDIISDVSYLMEFMIGRADAASNDIQMHQSKVDLVQSDLDLRTKELEMMRNDLDEAEAIINKISVENGELELQVQVHRERTTNLETLIFSLEKKLEETFDRAVNAEEIIKVSFIVSIHIDLNLTCMIFSQWMEIFWNLSKQIICR